MEGKSCAMHAAAANQPSQEVLRRSGGWGASRGQEVSAGAKCLSLFSSTKVKVLINMAIHGVTL
eukprot:scaffold1314_cov386-Pavlova_lutheri.AAC.10